MSPSTIQTFRYLCVLPNSYIEYKLEFTPKLCINKGNVEVLLLPLFTEYHLHNLVTQMVIFDDST